MGKGIARSRLYLTVIRRNYRIAYHQRASTPAEADRRDLTPIDVSGPDDPTSRVLPGCVFTVIEKTASTTRTER